MAPRRRPSRHRAPFALALIAAALGSSPGVGGAREGTAAVVVAARIPLAVAPFANHSGDARFDPLGKALADMLVTDLAQVSSLQVVERERLQALLDELRLADSGFLDPSTAQRMGRGVGARYLLTGAFVSVSPDLRIDARIVSVETGEVLRSEAVSGPAEDFFVLEKDLARRIVDGLDVALTAREGVLLQRVATESFEAVVAYARALDALDAGELERASAALDEALSHDGTFAAARARLAALQSRVEEARRRRATSMAATLDELARVLEARERDGGPVEDVPDLLSARMAEIQQPANARKTRRICKALLESSIPETLPLHPAAPQMGTLNAFVLAQAALSAGWLKDDAAAMTYGERFLERYPGSHWFLAVDQAVGTAIRRQKEIAAGRRERDAAIGAEEYESLRARMSTAVHSAPPDVAPGLWEPLRAAALAAGRDADDDDHESYGRALIRAGRIDECRALHRRLKAESPGAEAVAELASAISRWEGRQTQLHRARERWEADPSPETASSLASALVEAGSASEAEAFAAGALERFESTADDLHAGRLWRTRVDAAVALADWELALERLDLWERSVPAARFDPAYARRTREEAREAPRRLAELEALFVYRRAARLQQLHQFEEAAREFERFADLPTAPLAVPRDQALYSAGYAYSEAGRFADARSAWARLLREWPDSSMSQAASSLLSMLPEDE